jgi:hypothetical protein
MMADNIHIRNAEAALNRHANECFECLSDYSERCGKNAYYFGRLRDEYLAQYGETAPVRVRTGIGGHVLATSFAIKHYVRVPNDKPPVPCITLRGNGVLVNAEG